MNRTQTLPAGQRVRDWRKAKGLSIRDLAAVSGIHKSSLQRIEAGEQNLLESDVQRLIAGLKVTIAQFYGPIPSPKKRAA